MDADRFDALSRSLTDVRSRRVTLASLLGGTLVLVGLADAEAKKKCPPCKKRKQGKCKKKKPDGTACPGGACQSGKCVAVAPPPCQDKADFAECGGGKRCSGGVCAMVPGCFIGPCVAVGLPCCAGGTCADTTQVCPQSSQGGACLNTSYCSSGLTCVGFKCQ